MKFPGNFTEVYCHDLLSTSIWIFLDFPVGFMAFLEIPRSFLIPQHGSKASQNMQKDSYFFLATPLLHNGPCGVVCYYNILLAGHCRRIWMIWKQSFPPVFISSIALWFGSSTVAHKPAHHRYHYSWYSDFVGYACSSSSGPKLKHGALFEHDSRLAHSVSANVCTQGNFSDRIFSGKGVCVPNTSKVR